MAPLINHAKPLSGRGVCFAALAYALWGVLPLYWKLLTAVRPLHILSLRVLLSLLFTATLLIFQKKYAWLRLFKDRKKGFFLLLTGCIVTFNWGLFIWAVNSGRTVEASLGYYINPLVTVMLGLCFFREKLLPLQWAAFALAVAGVVILTVLSGALPWISLGLALSFGFYSLLKKNVSLSALESLGAESLAASPLGLLFLFGAINGGAQAWPQSLFYLTELPLATLFVLTLCGAVTAIPLYFFAKGAKLLPLSTLGFIQFISPTLQFIMGVFVFGETFPPRNYAAFAFIWTAAALYIASFKSRRT